MDGWLGEISDIHSYPSSPISQSFLVLPDLPHSVPVSGAFDQILSSTELLMKIRAVFGGEVTDVRSDDEDGGKDD